MMRKSLERPYTGPHQVLERIPDRVFKIDVNDAPRNVSVENIKPAFYVREDIETLKNCNSTNDSSCTAST